MTEYPAPKRPRALCWVSSPRTRSGVVEIGRKRNDPQRYDVVNPDNETIIFEGTWKEALAFTAGEDTQPEPQAAVQGGGKP